MNLSYKEAHDLMEKYGYTMSWRSGDKRAMGFTKTIDSVTLHCRLNQNSQDAWMFDMRQMPGVQLMVALATEPASFPHPKFQRFEQSMFKFAQACAAVSN